MSIFIAEILTAAVTGKLSIVQRLHGESIHSLAKIDLCPTVWTSILPFLPIFNARSTNELIAFSAFLRSFYYHKADGAGEVLVYLCGCCIR